MNISLWYSGLKLHSVDLLEPFETRNAGLLLSELLYYELELSPIENGMDLNLQLIFSLNFKSLFFLFSTW